MNETPTEPDRNETEQPRWWNPPNQTQNRRGEWVPAIPMPFQFTRKVCVCKRKFWTLEGYEAHYALVHVLGLGRSPDAL